MVFCIITTSLDTNGRQNITFRLNFYFVLLFWVSVTISYHQFANCAMNSIFASSRQSIFNLIFSILSSLQIFVFIVETNFVCRKLILFTTWKKSTLQESSYLRYLRTWKINKSFKFTNWIFNGKLNWQTSQEN